MNTSGEPRRSAANSAMSVAEAKERLRAWGFEAEEAQRQMIEAARQKARKATPFAALIAGVFGLVSAGRLFGRRKRREEREARRNRLGGFESLLPLVLAGAKLTPTLLGLADQLISKRRQPRSEPSE